jgi:hypothetical protein
MPVVPSELGVGAFERRVSVGLWLLDTAGCEGVSATILLVRDREFSRMRAVGEVVDGIGSVPVLVVLLRLIVLRRVLGFCAVSILYRVDREMHWASLTGHCDCLDGESCVLSLDVSGS